MSQQTGWKVELSGYPGNYEAEWVFSFILIVCFAFMSPVFQLRYIFALSGQVDVATKIKRLSEKKKPTPNPELYLQIQVNVLFSP